MGWLNYHIEKDFNGKFDKKGELDKMWNQKEHRDCNGTHYPELKVLKSSMIGSTYYAAIKSILRGEETIYAVVVLTSIDNTRYDNFGYKSMTEFYGPCQYQCPISILKLLTPTKDEYALEWRKKCYEYHNKKNQKDSLNKLPINSKIEVIVPFDTTAAKKGEKIILVKCGGYRKRQHSYWFGNGYKWSIKLIGDNYTILERGDKNE